jgi:uncharacterized membrane protein YidH (DUF202 family)
MLQKTVKMLVDAELAFPPGEQYNYGTVNYDVLGLVIEIVSGQSYEDFMRDQVFQPLDLHQTYVNKEDAQATGQLAQGYRSSFFMTTPYNAPDYSGNTPAGYIISCTKDIARWMGIQMGIVQDIPDIFHTVIEKSHQGDMSVPAVNDMYYAAGWSVNADQTIIEHTGGNPNFRTEVAILPNERTAVCLLSNGANANISLVLKVKDILDGNLTPSYEISGTQLLDIILSSTTIILCLLAVLLFLLGLRRRKTNERQPMTKKRIIVTSILLIATITLCILCYVLDWSTILIWQTYSFDFVGIINSKHYMVCIHSPIKCPAPKLECRSVIISFKLRIFNTINIWLFKVAIQLGFKFHCLLCHILFVFQSTLSSIPHISMSCIISPLIRPSSK